MPDRNLTNIFGSENIPHRLLINPAIHFTNTPVPPNFKHVESEDSTSEGRLETCRSVNEGSWFRAHGRHTTLSDGKMIVVDDKNKFQ